MASLYTARVGIWLPARSRETPGSDAGTHLFAPERDLVNIVGDLHQFTGLKSTKKCDQAVHDLLYGRILFTPAASLIPGYLTAAGSSVSGQFLTRWRAHYPVGPCLLRNTQGEQRRAFVT